MEPYVLAVCGSPRKGGNCDLLVDHVLKGAAEAGARTEKVCLYDIELRPCTACGVCLKPDRVDCVIPDDMTPLVRKVDQCDVLVIASPVYFLNITGPAKTFLDRLYPIASPVNRQFAGKRVIVCLTYGATDPVSTGIGHIVALFKLFFEYFNVSATFIHASALEKGDVLNCSDVLQQALDAGRAAVSS